MGQNVSTLGITISNHLMLNPQPIGDLSKKRRNKKAPKNRPFLKEAVVGSKMKTILFLGPIGTGKSTNMQCLLGNSSGGEAGLVDGTTSVECDSFLYTNPQTGVTYNMSLFDVFGFTGYELQDLYRLMALQKVLVQKNGGTISRIFYCYKWGRMTKGEAKILEFVKNICTDAMKDIIHVIVTHAPKNYFDDEDSMEEFQRHFSFLIQKENDLKNRFTFVNLIDPDVMEDHPESANYMKEQWETHRNNLLEVVISSDKACLVSDFKGTTVFQDWLRLNRFKIIFFTLGFLCLVLAILYQLAINNTNSLKTDKATIIEELKAVNQTAQALQEKYKFWIAIGSTIEGAKEGLINFMGNLKTTLG
mmetsp:Transcript_30656/g.33513  ORF Transcript_30656/g.33513 Transcript_30656/m.33513 type:complete len:361 (-) Transcript_30656:128-1210(-)|eukprot:gene15587-17470_t